MTSGMWCQAALLGFLLMLVSFSAPALAEKRIALVIVDGAYKAQNLLTNPPSDAHLISQALAKAHFDTIETKINLGIAEFRQALRRFQSQANGTDVAPVYYAGHGIETNGVNWLLPTDAELNDDRDLDYEAIKVDFVLQALANLGDLTGSINAVQGSVNLLGLGTGRQKTAKPLQLLVGATGIEPVTPTMSR